tara:strand:+ start:18190 stop:19545 length:1356 start_codon:yes stop_codon:yes gene_type:complete
MNTQIDTRELWEKILAQVELSISSANFNTWFKDSGIVRIDDSVVYIGVPSQFFKDWYIKKFHKLLLQIVLGISEDIRNIEYIIVRDEKRRHADRSYKTKNATGELPLEQYYINKSDNLNPRYTFDTFVVGSFNELAYAAAQASVKRPGITYNPLFIYGDTGRGKTHLIQSIGNEYKRLYPNRKVFYLASEKFAHEFQSAVANGTANRFKEKYRQYDLLIMDDIQFIAKMEKTQEELFHLFNYLHDNNKQIVFSSDRNPNHIPEIADRLQTRFSMGMIVDIGEPDTDSRISILRKKATQHGIVLPEETIEFIATTAKGSIRELEGILNSIVCQAQLKGETPSLNDVKHILKTISKPQRSISVKNIVSKIAEFYGIDEESIYEKTRRREVVRPRQVIMYILREDFSVSYPTIGSKLGGRDHTTVIHSCEKIKRELLTDTALGEEVDQVRGLLV